MSQFITVNLSHKDLEQFLVRCGLWATPELRQRHGYVLSPTVYAVSLHQQEQLSQLAYALYAGVQHLDTVLHRYGSTAPKTAAERQLLGLATRASRGLARPGELSCGVPPVMKVDLVQTPEGEYRVAEVDVYNPRGFAYMAFLDESVAHLGMARYPGVDRLAKLLAQFGTPDVAHLTSERERYYEPVFKVLQAILRNRGISLRLVREHELCASDESQMPEMLQQLGTNALTIIPDSLDKNPRARALLMRALQKGELKTLYPPKAFLGSKAFLPFLAKCDGVTPFMPHTALVSWHAAKSAPQGSWLLKEAMASGMKGIVFSDLEPERFVDMYVRAQAQRKPSWVLQAQVPQQPYDITVFDDNGAVRTSQYYLRVTLYTINAEVLGIDVTGRADRQVHGAPDCVQLPAVLV